MDIRILDSLRQASTIDLYELSVALEKMLADPQRVLEIRRHLNLGVLVSYFSFKRNTMHQGRVVQLNPSNLVVQDEDTAEQWRLSYAAVVPLTRKPSPDMPKVAPMLVSDFRVGETVSFTDKHLRERIGKITRLNSKTCSVDCEDKSQWRVGPNMLRKMIDL